LGKCNRGHGRIIIDISGIIKSDGIKKVTCLTFPSPLSKMMQFEPDGHNLGVFEKYSMLEERERKTYP
jgi:hypothetical protein